MRYDGARHRGERHITAIISSLVAVALLEACGLKIEVSKVTVSPLMICPTPTEQYPNAFSEMIFYNAGDGMLGLEIKGSLGSPDIKFNEKGAIEPSEGMVNTGLYGTTVTLGVNGDGTAMEVDLGDCVVGEEQQGQLQQFFEEFIPQSQPGEVTG